MKFDTCFVGVPCITFRPTMRPDINMEAVVKYLHARNDIRVKKLGK
jgi:hypothetical protein